MPWLTRLPFVLMFTAYATVACVTGLVTRGLVLACTWYWVLRVGVTVNAKLPELSVGAVMTFWNGPVKGNGFCWSVTVTPAFCGPVNWPDRAVVPPKIVVATWSGM